MGIASFIESDPVPNLRSPIEFGTSAIVYANLGAPLMQAGYIWCISGKHFVGVFPKGRARGSVLFFNHTA